MQNFEKLVVVVMAGGLGKRMESDLPKVLHKVGEKPMLVHILESLNTFSKSYNQIYKILVVVGKYREKITETLEKYLDIQDIMFVDQLEPMGTGHALKCCRDELCDEKYDDSYTLILSGDVPLISPETMFNMISKIKYVRIMVTTLSNPLGYGRVIENLSNFNSFSYKPTFNKIVEEKDCTREEKEVKKVNCGVYVIYTDLLCSYLPFITNTNAQGEYYLTDIIEIIKNHGGVDIEMYEIPKEKQYEIMGVNTKEQLCELEKLLK